MPMNLLEVMTVVAFPDGHCILGVIFSEIKKSLGGFSATVDHDLPRWFCWL